MCSGSSPSLFPHKQTPKRRRVRVLRLNRMRKGENDEMETRNLKLYMRNQKLREENERLRKQAVLLHRDNRCLVAELQNVFSSQLTSSNELI